jgi:hypothetical protein
LTWNCAWSWNMVFRSPCNNSRNLFFIFKWNFLSLCNRLVVITHTLHHGLIAFKLYIFIFLTSRRCLTAYHSMLYGTLNTSILLICQVIHQNSIIIQLNIRRRNVNIIGTTRWWSSYHIEIRMNHSLWLSIKCSIILIFRLINSIMWGRSRYRLYILVVTLCW